MENGATSATTADQVNWYRGAIFAELCLVDLAIGVICSSWDSPFVGWQSLLESFKIGLEPRVLVAANDNAWSVRVEEEDSCVRVGVRKQIMLD